MELMGFTWASTDSIAITQVNDINHFEVPKLGGNIEWD